MTASSTPPLLVPASLPPPLSAQPPPTPSLAKRLLLGLHGLHGQCSRYTLAKFREYDTYTNTTSSVRHAAVIVLAPVPSFLTSLLPTLIPLEDPALGIFENTGFVIHITLVIALVIFGSVHQVRAPNAISRDVISNLDAMQIAVIGASLVTAAVTAMAYLWRFPVPFVWVTALGFYVIALVVAHVVVLRGKLWTTTSLSRPLVLFIPTYLTQATQVVVYPIFSAIFEVADVWGQTALTLTFPLVKFFYRTAVRRLLRHLREDANEVAVSGIEICAAMYQSMIMQSVPSPFATAIIMALDATQNLVHIYLLTAKQSTIPQVELVPTARRLLSSEMARGVAVTVRDLKLRNTLSTSSVLPAPKPNVGEIPRNQGKTDTKAETIGSDALAEDAPTQQILTHALEIMHSAESILIIEYFEVVLPISNALYLLWACQFDSAVYNPRLRPYYFNPRLLGPAMGSLAMYTGLQALSLVMVYVLLRRRFGITAQPLLAFVLERHAWSLQGKLITWLALLFQFPVAHYGVDFKFKFDFSRASMGPLSPKR